jgi:RNA polymerase sigma factor (TIGR02999 family)
LAFRTTATNHGGIQGWLVVPQCTAPLAPTPLRVAFATAYNVAARMRLLDIASMNDEKDVPPNRSVTALIALANKGDADALNALFEALYHELHVLAHARLRRTAPMTILDTTSLVHESYLKLVKSGRLNVENRVHFLAYASRTMRSIIVDFARKRLAERRGSGANKQQLDTDVAQQVSSGEEEVIRVHDALLALAQSELRLAQVVEMRYYGGLNEHEIAEALGVTDRTVRRDWQKARLLLSVSLS